MDNSISMNLYDMNKVLISQIDETITVKEFCNQVEKMKKNSNNNYYFLFSKEISYFTLFSFKEQKAENDGSFGEIILSCFPSIFGDKYIVVSAESVANNEGLEIWIKDEKNEAIVFYLFPYDLGVVPVGE